MKSKTRKAIEAEKQAKKSEAYRNGSGESRYSKKFAFRRRVISGLPLPFYDQYIGDKHERHY